MGLFNPKNADESIGGLFPNDERARIIGAACVRFDYNGTKAPSPCIELEFEGEGAEKPVKQYFGVGKAEDWQPSPDGKTMVPLGKRAQLKGNTNAMLLYKSMQTAGVPEEILDADDVTALIGIDAHWVYSEIKREGLKPVIGKDGKEKKFGVFLVTQIYALPGEGAAALPTASPAHAKAVAAVQRYIAAAGKKGVKKMELPMLILQDAELAANPEDRNAVLTLLAGDDVLLSAGPWKFDSGVLKAAA